MNLTLPIKPNRNALSFVTGCISPRTTLPILSCIRLRADPAGQVVVSATDLDVTLSAVLETEVPFPALDVVVNGRTFLGLFKRDKNLIVEAEAPKGGIVIAVNGSRFTVPTMDVKDCAPLPKLTVGTTLSVLPAALETALHNVDVAISTDDSRYVLNGIYVEDGANGSLNMVATDGRRLHKTSCLVTGDALEHGFILPKYSVPHLHKLLAQQPEGAAVKVEVNNKKDLSRFTGARLTMISKLIEGNFPNYRQVIPNEENIKHRIEISVPEWITALEAVTPFTSEKIRSVKITLEHHVATLTVKNPDLGTGTATVAINWPKDRKPVSIAFDPEFLIDALTPHNEAAGCYAVHLGLIDELNPCVITTPTTTTVIMPMRLT